MRITQPLRTGQVVMFDDERGFGFVRDALTLTDSFFHVSEAGTLVGGDLTNEAALMLGGSCGCRPVVGDRLIYELNPHFERGPRATIWINEPDYQAQMRLIQGRQASVIAFPQINQLPYDRADVALEA